MIQVLIADDEPLARRGMEQLLAAHDDCRIVAVCRNGAETLRALRRLDVDVAFLDIQMPGLGGFNVLKLAEPATLPIIVFVTAYDEFAVRAFEERALDYLMKPVSQERFDRALAHVREQVYWNSTARRRLVVATPQGDIILDAAEIDWIEAEDYQAIIHTGQRRYIIRESLASLESRLDPARFLRVHRSAIVRLAAIREFSAHGAGGGEILLENGTRLPVSRRRRQHIARLLEDR